MSTVKRPSSSSDRPSTKTLLIAEGIGILSWMIISPVIATYGAMILSAVVLFGYVVVTAFGVSLDVSGFLVTLNDLSFGTVGVGLGWLVGDGDMTQMAVRLVPIVCGIGYLVRYVRTKIYGPPEPKDVGTRIKTDLWRYVNVSVVLIGTMVVLLLLAIRVSENTENAVSGTFGIWVFMTLAFLMSLVPVTAYIMMDALRTSLLEQTSPPPPRVIAASELDKTRNQREQGRQYQN